jgi:hypothetical protein
MHRTKGCHCVNHFAIVDDKYFPLNVSSVWALFMITLIIMICGPGIALRWGLDEALVSLL